MIELFFYRHNKKGYAQEIPLAEINFFELTLVLKGKLEYEINNKKYFALLPLKGEKELDFSQSYMLYEVEEDEEHNPIVLYIENDLEYEIAAQYFSRMLSKK